MELYVESTNGHDTLNVPDQPAEIQKAVENQLTQDKWVTLEKKDGNSELLTEDDMPEEEDEAEEEELDEEDKKWKESFATSKPAAKPAPTPVKAPEKKREEWESKFTEVKSATATHKAKGG